MRKLTYYAALCASIVIAIAIFSCQPESVTSTDTSTNNDLETGGNIALSQSVSMEIIAIFAQEMSKAGLISGFETGKLTTRGGGPKVEMAKKESNYFEASLDFGTGTTVEKRLISGKIYGKIWKKSNGELMRMILQPEQLNVEKNEFACKTCKTNTAVSDKNLTISGSTFYKGTLTLGNVSKGISGANKDKYNFRVKIENAVIGTPKNTRSFGFACLADCFMLADNGNSAYVADLTKFIDALITDYAKDSYELNILEATGTDYKGKIYKLVSRSAVHVDFACSWPKKGIVDVYIKNLISNFSVDFGDGTCDNIATMKVAGIPLLGTIKLP